jgi:hypothetical protein
MSTEPQDPQNRPANYLGEYLRSDPRLKSPVIAVLLSIMPGLGQAYLGYYQLGFINIFVVASLITLLAYGIGGLTPLVAIFLAFFWLFNLVDAGRRAMLLNQAITRAEKLELPDGFAAMSFKGRILGGLLLIAVGTLSIAHIRFHISMDWLQNWWPVALVIVGVYLVWQAVMERKE